MNEKRCVGSARVALVGWCALALVACQGGIDTGIGGDGGPPVACSPPCVAPQVCSQAGVCVDPASGCAEDGDCPAGMVCDQSGACVVAAECGQEKIEAAAVPPNLLIVLDRSCSMKTNLGGQSKWAIAVAALRSLLTAQQQQMRFGLILFPDVAGAACTQEVTAAPLAQDSAGQIDALLGSALIFGDANFPNGPCVTNIDAAMAQAAADPSLDDPTRDSYVLLITDGKQMFCASSGGDPGTTQIIAALHANKHVPTFVVGFGSGIDPTQLDLFAAAGGRPRSGATYKHYQAEDQASLEQALQSIAKKALGCVYQLDQVPADLDQIYVAFDGAPVAQDPAHQSGWDYQPAENRLTFYGQACEDLEKNRVAEIDVRYGCALPPPPDAGPPSECGPGITPCAAASDCPEDHACLAGCCTPNID